MLRNQIEHSPVVDSPQQLESILAVKQIVLELGLEFRPAAPDVPNLGAIGVLGRGASTARRKRCPARRRRRPLRSSPVFLCNLGSRLSLTGTMCAFDPLLFHP
jgi:hypothetical protein